ncbi:hypothetical protein [Telmatospirillum sp.]|uniref:hypothetical protein n=1 Tax=Telmatospirillum sp. TaxID=2079197 RepID=UPI00283BDA5E|nr:hypothetical protein [Telmatospirillum sp.]MDR3441298.1 hypothetical protein [Telmatospirillum sp.]
MLREAIAALTTPATRYARRLGYVHEGIAIEARFRRCYTDWLPHIGRCHKSILAAGLACPRRDRVVVLGSGPLCDIPLAELAGIFTEVVLIDVFHPPRARKLMARFSNVVAIEHDLLGQEFGVSTDDVDARLANWRQRTGAVDLVVSANLLAQLPVVPMASRLSRDLLARDVDAQTWSDAVMRAHIADLAAGPGQACLISEWRRHWFDRDGAEIDQESPLTGLSLPEPSESWRWVVAPPGELPGGASLEVDVGLFLLKAPRATGP